MNTCDKPLAAEGLTSYRYKSEYGFIMIGAKNVTDALKEAFRSMSYGQPDISNLQVWDGEEYKAV